MKTLLSHPMQIKCVGIWIRVSTEDQAKGESPEHHLERARAYAIAKGWEAKEVYDLAGVSGKSVIEHPEAKRMLSDIRRGHISGLIFSKLARLARNTRELLDFADIFRNQGADMISLQETIDTSTPSGRLFFTMIAAMAQWEREEIADRITASISVRAKLGKPLGGPSPYGYRWHDKKLVTDEKEASVRKKAFELFAQHRRKGLVARLLNEAGYRTRVGAQWTDVAIGRILRCPSAKGVYYLNRNRQTGNWQWEEKPESEWGTVNLTPIVTESLWALCNQIMEEQNKKGKRLGKQTVHVFAGMTFCSCGQRMYVKSNTPKYVCQKCNNKIPIVDLDAICLDELKAYFAAPEAIANHLARANEHIAQKHALLQTLRSEIQKLREEMEKTHRLYLDGQITAQGFGLFYKPAEERLNQLTTELPKLEADLDHDKVNAVSAEEVVAEAEALHTRWPRLPIDDKRRIVQAIFEKIVIGKGEIDITFSHLPSSEELVKNQRAVCLRLFASCPYR